MEHGQLKNSDLRIPQEGGVSLILSNLVLHELDVFIEGLLEEQNNKGLELDPMRKTERHKLIKLKWPPMLPPINLAKIYYVRYANEWIIGIVAVRHVAEEIKRQINYFIKDTLKLESLDGKTLIMNARKSKVIFLGTLLLQIPSVRGKRKCHVNTHRHSTTEMRMNAPIQKLVDQMIAKGIADKGTIGGIIPRPILSLVNLPIDDIILKYRMILKDILDYYSFVHNRPMLSLIY